MNKIKVLTVVGTRPEVIRLSRVINELEQYCDHKLVHTGQNYDFELNEIFFTELGIRKPEYFLSASGSSSSETIGNVIIECEKVLKKEMPDAVLILGDTNSCMSALAAKRLKIPIFHMEAGNRCFDMRVPEEINRKVVDHIADINLTYSSIAREYLLREGIHPSMIIRTGSPMNEVLDYYNAQIHASKILDTLKLKQFKYFLVSAHREENIDSDKNCLDLFDTINCIAKDFNLPVIMSTHPRTLKRIKNLKFKFNERVQVLKPLGFFDYNFLQINAQAVLSDSGTISEESSILNFPALNIREAHERPEAMEEGSVIMTGLKVERVKQALLILDTQSRGDHRELNLVRDYGHNLVSKKVVRIIHSYVDFVNSNTWKK